jgi:uroporphyrinogen decarboxylase
MTGKERITRILNHQPVDRIGLHEHFWGDTDKAWKAAGKFPEGVSYARHFNFDIDEASPFNMIADLDFERKVVAEDEDTVTYLDGNGAVFRRHKKHDTTPEHVDFKVKEREGWEKFVKPKLTPDPRRINFEIYRKVREECKEDHRFFAGSGLNAFEYMEMMCGHENMLVGMALDPDWVADMAMTYARLIVDLQKLLFEKEGYPDGIWYYDDLGFKEHPFMSPDMYRRILKPAHAYTFEYAKAHGMPVILHSCGFVEPLLPDIIDAGISCLQVIEVKAGMDLLRIHKLHGDRICFMGGIDVRTLYTNDRKKIDAELEAKIPVVKEGYNYIVQSDHSIPNTVTYDTYRYFINKALELGRY